jgi:hypothetical protein
LHVGNRDGRTDNGRSRLVSHGSEDAACIGLRANLPEKAGIQKACQKDHC